MIFKALVRKCSEFLLLNTGNSKSFIQEDGSFDTTTNCVTTTNISVEKHGLITNGKYQVIKHDTHIYPHDWFSPTKDDENNIFTTDNTHTIHHYYGSWLPLQMRKKIKRVIIKLFGTKNYGKIRSLKDGIIDFLEKQGIKNLKC